MEKVIFTDPDTKEKIEFYVLEETQINGKKFLFVTEEEDGDSEALQMKMMMLSTRWWKMTTNLQLLVKCLRN